MGMIIRLEFDKLSLEEQNKVLEQINDLIKLAEKYSGACVGDYVKNVIVPRSKDPNCKVDFTRVDLRFFYETDMYPFMDELGDKLKKTTYGEYYYRPDNLLIAITMLTCDHLRNFVVESDVDRLVYNGFQFKYINESSEYVDLPDKCDALVNKILSGY